MGRFGGTLAFIIVPPNNPTITWVITLDPGHHSFSKWAIQVRLQFKGALSWRFCYMWAKTAEIFDKDPPEHESTLRAVGRKYD